MSLLGFVLSKILPAPKECIFCKARKGPDFNVVAEDDNYIMFSDIRPAAAQHYLIVPKKHIETIQTLKKEDVGIVREMLNMGEKYFDEQGVPKEERRFGFHIPPAVFINHLHFHCLALPLKGMFSGYMFSVAESKDPNYLKGWGVFVEVNQAINILEKEGTFTVSAVQDPLASPRL
ncbi:HIT-like protein [Serendipita vermifera]|nr:HIT-like protein [Serendipita vermifera]